MVRNLKIELFVVESEPSKQNMYKRAFFSILALGAASAILALSLTSNAMRVHSADGILTRSFYMDDQVLPDHITYPFLMAIDRLRLESASPTEKVYLQTEYANRRLAYATELFNRDESDLAVTTLTKAQKYLLHAGQHVLYEQNNARLNTHLSKTIEYHVRHIEKILDSQDLSDSQRAVIDKLTEELLVIHGQLQQ